MPRVQDEVMEKQWQEKESSRTRLPLNCSILATRTEFARNPRWRRASSPKHPRGENHMNNKQFNGSAGLDFSLCSFTTKGSQPAMFQLYTWVHNSNYNSNNSFQFSDYIQELHHVLVVVFKKLKNIQLPTIQHFELPRPGWLGTFINIRLKHFDILVLMPNYFV